MQLRDATSVFGRVVILIPLILVFLTFADSAFACPGHTNGAAYRTRVKTRSWSNMPTTVIAYRAPATYRRCGNNLYDTRGARYISSGHRSGAKYVAVRNGGDYRTSRARHIAVRNADYYDDAPRYVAVRRQPVYMDRDVRYVAVRRSEPRVRYIKIDDDDDVRYIAVRRSMPRTKYVAVRDVDLDDDDDVRYVTMRSYAPRTRYVAVRDAESGCMHAAALKSCVDRVDTMSTRQVVLRTDNGYSNGSRYVAVRNEIDDDDVDVLPEEIDDIDMDVLRDEVDDDYVTAPVRSTSYVEYAPANSYYNSRATYIDADDMENPCMRRVALRSCAEPVSTRTVTYRPVAYDDDIDHLAFLDGSGATYVADDEIENACMSSRYVPASPRAVSYVPIDDDDDYAFHDGSDISYIETDYAAPSARHVVLVEDELADAETTYIAADEMDAETVSYVPADHDEFVETENVSYVPADDMHTTSVSYVPVDDVDVTYIDAVACPMAVSNLAAETMFVADDSAVLVEDSEVELVGTEKIAGNFGYRDGFEDGRDAALEGDEYHPENFGDFRKATEGYEDDYGDKDVYKDVYRSTYLDGYQAGFESAASIV